MNDLDKLQGIFCDIFDDERLKIDFNTDAGSIEEWDSLTHIVLIEEIQNSFNIKFSNDEIFSISSVGDILSLIEKHRQGRS